MTGDLIIEPQDDGRIFLKYRGLIVFISRDHNAIANLIKIKYSKIYAPGADKNDWIENPGPWWRG